MSAESCGQFEQLVLTAIAALGEGAYGVTIHKKVADLSEPRKVALGAVYVTLDRMEDKGFITSRLSEPTAERGGRAKRCYWLEKAGQKALEESVIVARRMSDALAEVWGAKWNTA